MNIEYWVSTIQDLSGNTGMSLVGGGGEVSESVTHTLFAFKAFPQHILVPYSDRAKSDPSWLSQDICGKVILRCIYGTYLSAEKDMVSANK